RVFDFEKRQPGDGRRAAAHDGRRRAIRLGVLEERVRVEAVAFEGEKQGAWCQVSGFRLDSAELEIGGSKHADGLGDPTAGPKRHDAPSSRTTSRSSKCCLSV